MICIQARGRYSLWDIYRATPLQRSYRRFSYTVTIFSLLFFGLTFFLWWTGTETTDLRLAAYSVGFAGLLWLLPLLGAYQQMRSSVILRVEICYEFDDQNLRWSNTFGQSQLDWSAFTRWREGRRVMVIFASSASAHIIPKRFFASPSDLSTARELFTSRIGRPS